MSKCYVYTRKQPCVSFNKHSINGQLQTLLLKYDIIIICHFLMIVSSTPSGLSSGSATDFDESLSFRGVPAHLYVCSACTLI